MGVTFLEEVQFCVDVFQVSVLPSSSRLAHVEQNRQWPQFGAKRQQLRTNSEEEERDPSAASLLFSLPRYFLWSATAALPLRGTRQFVANVVRMKPLSSLDL